MCYFFNDIINYIWWYFYAIIITIDNILIYEKSFGNILIYEILYKTLISPNPLCIIRFNKIDGFIRIYDRTRYLALLGPEKYDAVYNRIRYLISVKSDIRHVFSHYYANMKFDSYHSLPIRKILTLYDVIYNTH